MKLILDKIDKNIKKMLTSQKNLRTFETQPIFTGSYKKECITTIQQYREYCLSRAGFRT